MKPMLAYNGEWKFSDILHWPVACTSKRDGIRAITTQAAATTRSGKRIPNVYIDQCLAELPSGLDGEVITYTDGFPDNFHTTSGKFRTFEGLPVFKYFIFDCMIAGMPYLERIEALKKTLPNLPGWCELLLPTLCSEEQHVRIFHSHQIACGYEGTMVRNPKGRYKHGRCTLRESNMFKLLEWEREEGIIKGFTPNEEHVDRIGAIVVHTDKWGLIKLGSGFSLDI